MHKLEITGATPEDLFMNAVRMLTVLLKGGSQPMAPLGDSRREPVVIDQNVNHSNNLSTDSAPFVSGHEAEQEQAPAEEAKPKAKRGRPSKADKASEAPADLPTEKTVELNDDISDLGGKPAETERALTLNDDIRPRLQAIQKACVARGLDMSATVAYILKLYGPFGIVKAEQLKPEQFAEFLEASEAYLSGEA